MVEMGVLLYAEVGDLFLPRMRLKDEIQVLSRRTQPIRAYPKCSQQTQTFQTLFILWNSTPPSLRTHDQVRELYENDSSKAPDLCQKTVLQVRDTYERLTTLHITASSLQEYNDLHTTERRCVLEVASSI